MIRSSNEPITDIYVKTVLKHKYDALQKACKTTEALAMGDYIGQLTDSIRQQERQADVEQLQEIREQEEEIADKLRSLTMHRIILIATVILLLTALYIIWRVHRYNRQLAQKNHQIYQRIREQEQHEQETRVTLAAQSEETLTQHQQLYRRLCELMEQPSVSMPSTLTRIGKNAFYDAEMLTEVTVPQNVTAIGPHAFRRCTRLASITLPDEMSSIGECCFYDDSLLTTIKLPKGLTTIMNHTFYNCKGITTVNIPGGVATIEEATFSECTSLASVTISEGVTRIDNYAFESCQSLASISFPKSLTAIGSGAFYDCIGLKAITIPENDVQMGEYPFDACSGIESIIVEERNTVYDSRDNCDAIIETATNTLLFGCQNTVIPEGITTIATGAFYRCTPLTSITIPEGVTAMYDGAFQESGLTSVSIPSTMTYIDICVFQDCTSLTEVYCHAEAIPETGEDTFTEVPLAAATLYVPAASLDLYKATAPWSQFGTIRPIDTVVGIAHYLMDGEFSPCQPIYDLNGRQMVSGESPKRPSLRPGSAKAPKGVYIREGKKYMMK